MISSFRFDEVDSDHVYNMVEKRKTKTIRTHLLQAKLQAQILKLCLFWWGRRWRGPEFFGFVDAQRNFKEGVHWHVVLAEYKLQQPRGRRVLRLHDLGKAPIVEADAPSAIFTGLVKRTHRRHAGRRIGCQRVYRSRRLRKTVV